MDLENYTNVNIFKKVFENREVTRYKNVIEQPHHLDKDNVSHAKSQFNPYVNNQGTTVGKLNRIFNAKNIKNFTAAHLLTKIFKCSYCWQRLRTRCC